jgi:hypothetical protein
VALVVAVRLICQEQEQPEQQILVVVAEVQAAQLVALADLVLLSFDIQIHFLMQ